MEVWHGAIVSRVNYTPLFMSHICFLAAFCDVAITSSTIGAVDTAALDKQILHGIQHIVEVSKLGGMFRFP